MSTYNQALNLFLRKLLYTHFIIIECVIKLKFNIRNFIFFLPKSDFFNYIPICYFRSWLPVIIFYIHKTFLIWIFLMKSNVVRQINKFFGFYFHHFKDYNQMLLRKFYIYFHLIKIFEKLQKWINLLK